MNGTGCVWINTLSNEVAANVLLISKTIYENWKVFSTRIYTGREQGTSAEREISSEEARRENQPRITVLGRPGGRTITAMLNSGPRRRRGLWGGVVRRIVKLLVRELGGRRREGGRLLPTARKSEGVERKERERGRGWGRMTWETRGRRGRKHHMEKKVSTKDENEETKQKKRWGKSIITRM